MICSNIIQRALKAIKKRKSPPAVLTVVSKKTPELQLAQLPALECLLKKLVSDNVIIEHTQAIPSVRIASLFSGTNGNVSNSKVTYHINADELNCLYSAN